MLHFYVRIPSFIGQKYVRSGTYVVLKLTLCGQEAFYSIFMIVSTIKVSTKKKVYYLVVQGGRMVWKSGGGMWGREGAFGNFEWKAYCSISAKIGGDDCPPSLVSDGPGCWKAINQISYAHCIDYYYRSSLVCVGSIAFSGLINHLIDIVLALFYFHFVQFLVQVWKHLIILDF